MNILLKRFDIDEFITIQNIDKIFDCRKKHYQLLQINEIGDVNNVHQTLSILMGGALL